MAKYENGMKYVSVNEAMEICKEFLQKNNITHEDVCQDCYLATLEYMKGSKRSSSNIRSMLKNYISMYLEYEHDDEMHDEDIITMTELINSVLLKDALDKMMSSLTDKQRLVIELRMQGYTLAEVAEDMGFKYGEHVRQIEAKALMNMRHPSRSIEFIELFSEILNS